MFQDRGFEVGDALLGEAEVRAGAFEPFLEGSVLAGELLDPVLEGGALRGQGLDRLAGETGWCGATAWSTPKTGRTPAAAAAFANRTTPVTLPRSVSASVPIPRSAARATRALG